jgi:hypothetical protein
MSFTTLTIGPRRARVKTMEEALAFVDGVLQDQLRVFISNAILAVEAGDLAPENLDAAIEFAEEAYALERERIERAFRQEPD